MTPVSVRPHKPKDPKLGQYLRVVTWNIEKSYHSEAVIKLLTSENAFRRMLDDDKVTPDSEEYREISRQRERLLNADILILQEMDIGNKRSGYVDAARELASALDMNYAYGAGRIPL